MKDKQLTLRWEGVRWQEAMYSKEGFVNWKL